MNIKRGFRRITLVLAIPVSVICWFVGMWITIDKRSSALIHLSLCYDEFSRSIPVAEPNERPVGWPYRSSYGDLSDSDYLLKLYRFLESKHNNVPGPPPGLPLSSEEAKKVEEYMEFFNIYDTCLKKGRSYRHAYYNFWSRIRPSVFVGICVSASLGSALAGFCGVWLTCKILEWIVVGFRDDKSKDNK